MLSLLPTGRSSCAWKYYHETSRPSIVGQQPMERSLRPETVCARARDREVAGPPPLAMPVYQTAVWQLESLEQCDAISDGEAPGYIYTRDPNPNHTALEALLAPPAGAVAARGSA